MYRKSISNKRVFILVLFHLFILSPLLSQGVVFNVLDKTKGKAQLNFYQKPKINNDEFSKKVALGEKKELTDSTFQVFFNPGTSNTLITCSWLYDSKPVLLIWGDSLNVLVDYSDKDNRSFQVTFIGTNERNYNSNTEKQRSGIYRNILSRIRGMNNLQERLRVIDSVYVCNTLVLKDMPTSVYKEMKIGEEKANYFSYLYSALYDSDEVLPHAELLSLKDKIFSGTIDCQSPFLMEDSYYLTGITLLCRLLCQHIKSDHQLMASTDTINKYFSGELRDYLLSTNFYDVCLSNQREHKKDPDVEIWYGIYKGQMREPVYNDYILFTYNEYKKLDASFPSDILSEKVISISDSSEISIGDLLSRYRGNPVIIDHWATWCGACIQEIVQGEENTVKLEEQGVRFIYLSLDNLQNFNLAKQKAMDLKISEKAYILPGNFETRYIKYLNISFIPRYVLMDAEGKVINTNLARPRDITDYGEYIK